MILNTRNYYSREGSYRDTPRLYKIDREDAADFDEPVSLADMKAWLRVDYETEDALINQLISAARAGVEQYCSISIIEKTVNLTADWYGEWELPYAPVKSVVSVTTSTGGAYSDATLGTDYYLDGAMFRYDGGRVRVEYITGMDVVPPDLVADIKRVVAYLYEHRGDEPMTTLQGGLERPKGLDSAMELFCKKHKKLWV